MNLSPVDAIFLTVVICISLFSLYQTLTYIVGAMVRYSDNHASTIREVTADLRIISNNNYYEHKRLVSELEKTQKELETFKAGGSKGAKA